MQQIFKSDDPIRDAERYAEHMEMNLHKCMLCDLEIEPDEKFSVHTFPKALAGGKVIWENRYICKFCLESSLMDVMTYEQEGWEI